LSQKDAEKLFHAIKILLLTYKALISDSPSYLKELVKPYCPARELRSLNASVIKPPPSLYLLLSWILEVWIVVHAYYSLFIHSVRLIECVVTL